MAVKYGDDLQCPPGRAGNSSFLLSQYNPKEDSMTEPLPEFRRPSAFESSFNRLFGFLVGLGVGPAYNFLLEVRGRKSGKIFATPVNLLEMNGKQFLVAPRGRTQWVRNAEASGEVTLKRGISRRRFRLRPLADTEKPPVLKEYLERFKGAVQRYFAVPAGSPVAAFAEVAASYPAFELIGEGQRSG
jgi:deazaflavin-dependent oxidoreductase (nitroreductase family)